MNGFAAHVGDAEQHASGFMRQPAVPKSAEFRQEIVVVDDVQSPRGAMRRGAALLDELDGAGSGAFQIRTAASSPLSASTSPRAPKAGSSAALVAGMRLVRARHEPLKRTPGAPQRWPSSAGSV